MGKKKQYSADISGSPGSYILTWSNKAVYTQKNADDTAVLLEGEEGEAKEEEEGEEREEAEEGEEEKEEEEGEFRLFSFRSPLQEGEEGEEEKEEAMTNNQACAILDGKYVVTNSLMTKLGAETAVFEQNGCSGKYTFFNNENEKLDLWSPNKLYTLTYRVV